MSFSITPRGDGRDLVLIHGWAMHGGTFARESLRAREVGVADGCSQGVCAVVWPRVVIKGEDVSHHEESVRTFSSAMMSLGALYSRLFQVEVLLVVCQKFVVHSIEF